MYRVEGSQDHVLWSVSMGGKSGAEADRKRKVGMMAGEADGMRKREEERGKKRKRECSSEHRQKKSYNLFGQKRYKAIA